MKEVSEFDILSKLDPLKEYEPKYDLTVGREGGNISSTRRMFYTDDLYITIYTSPDSVVTESLWELYQILNKAAGDIIKAFRKDNAIFVSWPRFEDKFDDATYTLMVEELARVSSFLLKELGTDEEVEKMVSNYIEMCISWKE